jgi:hypothetical protein
MVPPYLIYETFYRCCDVEENWVRSKRSGGASYCPSQSGHHDEVRHESYLSYCGLAYSNERFTTDLTAYLLRYYSTGNMKKSVKNNPSTAPTS